MHSRSFTVALFLTFSFGFLTLVGCSEDPGSAVPTSTPSPGGGYADGGGYQDGYGGYSDGYGGYGGSGGGDEVPSQSGDDYAADDASDESAGDSSASDDAYAGYGAYGNPNEGVGPPPANRDGYQDPYANAQAGGYPEGEVVARSDDSYAGYGAPGGAAGGSGMYATQIEPLLRQHCFSCHGGGARASKGDLVLSSPDAVRSVVRANQPDDSELFIRIAMEPGEKERMPPKGPGLSTEEVALVRSWIQQGASFDAGGGGGYSDGYGGYAAAGGYGGGGINRGDQGDGGYPSDDGDGRPQAPAPPKNLAEAASLVFQRGDDRLAMNHLYAQTLVQSDDANDVLSKYQWVPGLKRPKLAVRWGIGVKYNAKGGFEGAPRPVGVDQDIPNLDDDTDASEAVEIPVDFRNEALNYYTGKVGDELVFRLQNRIERAYYGEILQQELEKSLVGPRDEEDDFDDSDGGYGSQGISRSSSDGYGGYGGYGGSGRGGGGDAGDSEKPENRIEQVMPGVTMLGEHSQANLFQLANEQGVDLLVIFDITVDRNLKARLITNSTKVRLYDVASQTQLAVTSALRNVEIQRALAEDAEDNEIFREMDKIFEVADKSYKMKEFPATAEPKHAVAFVKNLLADKSENPLWKLSEVRFYQSRGLLKDEHAASAYKRIAPELASKLVNISADDEVKTMFTSWLTPADSGDGDFADEDGEGRPRRRREFR